MPNDQYHEVFIVITAGSIIFIALAAAVTFILLFYQRKKLQHAEQLIIIEQQYTEQLLHAKIEMQEQTFNAISQEIHDNVGQTLSLAKVQMNIIEQKEMMDKELFGEAKANIGKAMTDLRDIARSLNTDKMSLFSLPAAISEEAARIERTGIVQIIIQTDGNEVSVDEQKKLIIFRMVQESLQNIIKHSKANLVQITLSFEPGYMLLTVADNGAGFYVEEMKQNAGLGLQNIISRARLIGGSATIESKINEGTTITINIPYA